MRETGEETRRMKGLPTGQVMAGDALEQMRRLPEASVDTVVTSPPYWMLRRCGVEGEIGSEDSAVEWVARLRAVMAQAARVLKPEGAVWLNLGDTYSRHLRHGALPKSLVLGPERLLLGLIEDGWRLRNKVIWAKPNPMPASVRDRLSSTWEPLYLLVRSRHYYFDPIIDLEVIASLPRLDLRFKAGLPVSGFSEWSRGRWVVAINEADHWTRQRFTLAHEIKHVLDNPYADVLYPGRDGKPSRARTEAVCDYFAACLLMPRPAIKRAWATGHQRFDDLAAHFGVSKAAMGLRLHQLGLTSGRKRCGHLPVIRYERAAAPSFASATAQGSRAWTS